MIEVNPSINIFLGDPSNIDQFHAYWMSVADPRQTYELTRQDYLMNGGGYY
jgi:hypothetical protein